MTTVDVLETRYKLTDQYTPSAQRIAETTEGVGARINGLHQRLSALQGVLAAIATVAAVAVGRSFMQMSADMEQYRLTLEALTRSQTLAAEKIDFLRKLAEPSTFTAEQLIKAGIQLEAFGLRIEKVMPSLAKLGQAFKADQEHLAMLTRMFGELGAGNFPDKEVLSSFGLNRQMFEKQGIQFDKQGVLLSSAKDTLDALERIVEERYGDIFDKMAGSQNAILGSLQDAWERLGTAIGDVLNQSVTPLIEKTTKWLNDVARVGDFQQKIEQLGHTLDKLARTVAVIAGVWAAFIALSTIGTIAAFGRHIISLGVAFMTVARQAGLLTAIISVLQMLTTGGTAWWNIALAAVAGTAVWYGFNKLIDMTEAALTPEEKVQKGTMRNPATTPKGGWSSSGSDADLSAPMKETARNTAAIARHTGAMLDLRRYAIGGGDLGAMGVTPAELGGGRGRGARRVQIDFSSGSGRLGDLFERLICDTINQLARQGAFDFGGR